MASYLLNNSSHLSIPLHSPAATVVTLFPSSPSSYPPSSSSAILLGIPLKFMTFLCSPVYTTHQVHTHSIRPLTDCWIIVLYAKIQWIQILSMIIKFISTVLSIIVMYYWTDHFFFIIIFITVYTYIAMQLPSFG